MGVITYLKRIKKALALSADVIRFGGINTVNISSINWNSILAGKTALITGGGSGIGFTIAQKFDACGAKVILVGRNEDKLKGAIEKIKSEKVSYFVWDISDVENLSYNLDQVMNEHGNIDILINNAGVQPMEFFPNVTEKEWDRIYNINSKGTFFVSEEMCKRWMAEKNKHNLKKIINIDSQGGFVGATYPYRMSKWDIRGLTRGLGLKMASQGVLVNGIAPGVVKTEMQEFSLRQGDNLYCNQNALERVCLPEEIAELAVYMASDSCNFMVGQTILVDGGASLK